MKKILLLVLMAFFVLPIAAEDYSRDKYKQSFFDGTKAPPAEFLDALAFMEGYSPDQNGPFTAQQNEYIEMTRGIVVLNFSFYACTPCYDVWSYLGEQGIFDLWKKKGVRYYQIDSANMFYSAPYIDKFEVFSSPTMVFLVDGKEYARRRGGVNFNNPNDGDDFLKQIKTLTKLD